VSVSDEEVCDADALIDGIAAVLEGEPPELQGAALAYSLATFIAGHSQWGEEKMWKFLQAHIDIVTRTIPARVWELKQRRLV
jgi:hypothetical protein